MFYTNTNSSIAIAKVALYKYKVNYVWKPSYLPNIHILLSWYGSLAVMNDQDVRRLAHDS